MDDLITGVGILGVPPPLNQPVSQSGHPTLVTMPVLMMLPTLVLLEWTAASCCGLRRLPVVVAGWGDRVEERGSPVRGELDLLPAARPGDAAHLTGPEASRLLILGLPDLEVVLEGELQLGTSFLGSECLDT